MMTPKGATARRIACLVAGLVSLTGCQRQPAAVASQHHASKPLPTENAASAMSTAAAAEPNAAMDTGTDASSHVAHTLHSMAGFSAPIHRFSIPLKRAQFSFVDLGYQKPLVDALGSHTFVFNGGYWAFAREKRVIQGLVIVNDHMQAQKTRASGGVVAVRAGRASMVESSHYFPTSGTALAIQCSPRLVSGGEAVERLNKNQKAARTALCITADSAQLQVYLTDPTTRPTLVDFAAFLKDEGCIDALNLDGGPSTAAVASSDTTSVEVGYGADLPYGIGVTLIP